MKWKPMLPSTQETIRQYGLKLNPGTNPVTMLPWTPLQLNWQPQGPASRTRQWPGICLNLMRLLLVTARQLVINSDGTCPMLVMLTMMELTMLWLAHLMQIAVRALPMCSLATLVSMLPIQIIWKQHLQM